MKIYNNMLYIVKGFYNKMYLFEEIMDRIKDYFNYKTDKELYDKIGITQGVFSNWRKRNKIPYNEIITLCFNENIDLKYILNGQIDEGKIKKIDFREENHKIIEQINDENQEIIYHILKAESLKIEKL